MQKTFCTGLAIVVLLLISVPVYASYSLSLPVSIRGEYNDNIFLDSSNEEEDFITTVSPVIMFNYAPVKALDLSLYYGLNFKYYDRHSYLNHNSVEDAQEIVFKAHVKPSNFFFIDISDTYERVPLDLRKKSVRDNASENMTSTNELKVSPYVKLPLTNTVFITGGYVYENIWYEDEGAVNYDNHTAFFDVEKKYTPRITGTLKYEFIAHRPDLKDMEETPGELEYDRHEASFAVDYKMKNGAVVKGEAGQAWFKYRDIDDKEKFFWNAGVDNIFKFTPYTSLGVNYGIDFKDTSSSGAAISQELDLEFKTGKRLELVLSPYYRDIEYLNIDRNDRVAGVDSELSRLLAKRVKASLNADWKNIRFAPEDEEITKYGVGGSIDYSLSRSIKIYAGYKYNNQDASADIDSGSIEINDYDNNIFWLQSKVIF